MFQKLVSSLAEKFKEFNLPYMVIGGQAVLLYGEPRLTKDIDITLGIGTNEYKKVLNIINLLNLNILVEDVESFVNQFMVLPCIDKKSGIKIDFIFSFTPYEHQAIKRGNKKIINKVEVNFASLEDVIIHKIFAGRARDLEDVKSILLKNKDYDSYYIEKWLTEFDKSLSESFLKRFKDVLKK